MSQQQLHAVANKLQTFSETLSNQIPNWLIKVDAEEMSDLYPENNHALFGEEEEEDKVVKCLHDDELRSQQLEGKTLV